MRTSYAMIASSVTPPAEDEGEEVDGAVEARGAVMSVQGLPQSKLCCTSSNGSCIDGSYEGEVGRLEIEDRKMVKELHDRRKKNEHITSRHILIDIYKGEYEVRREVNRKILSKG